MKSYLDVKINRRMDGIYLVEVVRYCTDDGKYLIRELFSKEQLEDLYKHLKDFFEVSS